MIANLRVLFFSPFRGLDGLAAVVPVRNRWAIFICPCRDGKPAADFPTQPCELGPAASPVVRRADAVRARLAATRRRFLSLRRVADLLGVSTQPVRRWIRGGHLRRGGPRGQVPKGELERFLGWLCELERRFGPQSFTARSGAKRGQRQTPFQKVKRAAFSWPKGRAWLSPRELAERIGCDASLVRKALRARMGRPARSADAPGRWRVTRQTWEACFPFARVR